MRVSALASFSISLAAALAFGGDGPLDPARVATVEIEAKLARQPSIYLVLDPPRRVFEVRARGIVLDSIVLSGIETVTQRPLFGGVLPTLPQVPGEWSVEDGPGDTDREVISPTTLRPYSSDDEDEPASPSPAPPGTRGPAPTPTPVPEAPASYRTRLDNGWDLWITDRLPPTGMLQRYVAAVRDGWDRLRGLGRSYRPAVMLAVSSQDARRLHHLMRKGMVILVAAGAP
jgi:hypothetical protein